MTASGSSHIFSSHFPPSNLLHQMQQCRVDCRLVQFSLQQTRSHNGKEKQLRWLYYSLPVSECRITHSEVLVLFFLSIRLYWFNKQNKYNQSIKKKKEKDFSVTSELDRANPRVSRLKDQHTHLQQYFKRLPSPFSQAKIHSWISISISGNVPLTNF